jgi:hypothetical protein
LTRHVASKLTGTEWTTPLWRKLQRRAATLDKWHFKRYVFWPFELGRYFFAFKQATALIAMTFIMTYTLAGFELTSFCFWGGCVVSAPRRRAGLSIDIRVTRLGEFSLKRVIVCFGQFCENYQSSLHVWATFSHS